MSSGGGPGGGPSSRIRPFLLLHILTMPGNSQNITYQSNRLCSSTILHMGAYDLISGIELKIQNGLGFDSHRWPCMKVKKNLIPYCLCLPAVMNACSNSRWSILHSNLLMPFTVHDSAEKLHGKNSHARKNKKTHVAYDLLNVLSWSVSIKRTQILCSLSCPVLLCQ